MMNQKIPSKLFLLISLLLVIGGCSLFSNEQSEQTISTSSDLYAPNEILVKFVKGTSDERVKEIATEMFAESQRVHKELNIYRIRSFKDEAIDIEEIIRQAETYVEVEYTEPTYIWMLGD